MAELSRSEIILIYFITISFQMQTKRFLVNFDLTKCSAYATGPKHTEVSQDLTPCKVAGVCTKTSNPERHNQKSTGDKHMAAEGMTFSCHHKNRKINM